MGNPRDQMTRHTELVTILSSALGGIFLDIPNHIESNLLK